jgi:hypothetical protein
MNTKRILQFALVALCLSVPLAAWAADPIDPINTAARDGLTGNPAQGTSVSWGAVFGGAVVALSLQMLFTVLGAGIGAAAIDPYDRQNPMKGVPTGALVWWLATGLISLFVGGWVSGKLSGATTLTDASLTVGGMHGLLMWSLATVLTFLLLLTSAGALVGGMMRILYEGIALVGKGAASAASATASVAGPLVGDAVKEGVKQIVPSFDWEKVKREVRSLLRESGKPELQPENVEKKVDQAKQGVQNFVKDPMAGDEELSSMLGEVYGKVREAVNSGDRDTLVNMLSARTGKNKDEINKSLDKVEKVYQDVKREYNEAVATAERKAREAAAETASFVSKVTVWTFVALVGGMVVTTIGATMGVSRPTLFYFW